MLKIVDNSEMESKAAEVLKNGKPLMGDLEVAILDDKGLYLLVSDKNEGDFYIPLKLEMARDLGDAMVRAVDSALETE